MQTTLQLKTKTEKTMRTMTSLVFGLLIACGDKEEDTALTEPTSEPTEEPTEDTGGDTGEEETEDTAEEEESTEE